MPVVDTRGMPTRSTHASMKRSLRARDAGLSKISVTTRIVLAASLAATGMFTAAAAWAQSGRTHASSSNASARAAGSSSATNLSPPVALPVSNPGYTTPVVVSGAS